MKLGIRKIRHILASRVGDYSQLPAGSSFNFAAFLSSALEELPFTPESADFQESWKYDENGKYSEMTLTAAIRADKETYRPVLQQLQGKRFIFEVELISGVKYVIGSKEFLPTFTYSDAISGISSNGFTINISLQSLHGVLLDSD
mgnify:CR=1 FL=1